VSSSAKAFRGCRWKENAVADDILNEGLRYLPVRKRYWGKWKYDVVREIKAALKL
jgi:hypothetical protein